MIACSRDIGYIHEPFNRHHSPGICAAHFDYWFPYICEANEHLYVEPISDCIHFKHRLLSSFQAESSLKQSLKSFAVYLQFARNRFLNKRPLVKDPIAFFSAEWLSSTYNMDVIVLIRHPAAFIGSLKQANWHFPFSHLLLQPMLMSKYLAPFETKIVEYSKHEKDLIDQGILLWNLIHYVVKKYQEMHKRWLFIRHEDISNNPIKEFKQLYKNLNLQFTPSVEQKISSYCFSRQNHRLKRNSKENTRSWLSRLNSTEIQKIRRDTDSISGMFYSDQDWGID
jgi:hypothetical protein